jgi:hypothetical protein
VCPESTRGTDQAFETNRMRLGSYLACRIEHWVPILRDERPAGWLTDASSIMNWVDIFSARQAKPDVCFRHCIAVEATQPCAVRLHLASSSQTATAARWRHLMPTSDVV